MKSLDKGQLALSLGVAGLGLFFLVGSFQIPDAAGYSTVGPAVVPRAVGIALLVCAAFLIYEVIRGGFKNHDEAAERKLVTDWIALGWISAGLILYGVLIEKAGFIFASIVLFLCVARGFNSRRWATNAIIALLLAVGIFSLFTYGLGLNLPKGLLSGIL